MMPDLGVPGMPGLAGRSWGWGRLAGRIGDWLVRLTDGWIDRIEQDRERRALAALDERVLRDLGLSRADVERALRSQGPRQRS